MKNIEGHVRCSHDVTVLLLHLRFQIKLWGCPWEKVSILQIFGIFFMFTFVFIPLLQLWVLSKNNGKCKFPTIQFLCIIYCVNMGSFHLKKHTTPQTHNFFSQERSLSCLLFSKSLYWLAVMQNVMQMLAT